MFVIVTLAPGTDAPIHVYGGPWNTRYEAEKEAKAIRDLDREMYPGEPPSHILVRKIITEGDKPNVGS